MPKSTLINVGNRVSFENAIGTYCGTVIDILPCITNGRQHATVEIESERPGTLENVPVDELMPAKPAMNIVFLTGDLNPFPNVSDERRFFALPSISKN